MVLVEFRVAIFVKPFVNLLSRIVVKWDRINRMGRWIVVAASSSSLSHIVCDSEFNSLVNVCAEYDGTLAVVGRRSWCHYERHGSR